MIKNIGKISVIIMGPPGSGKGTQAKLLAEKLSLYQFDSGNYIRKILYDPKFKNNKDIKRERLLNEKGGLNTPLWVLKIVRNQTQKISRLGESVIFSGSIRTWLEAFGDKKRQGLLALLEKEYGKKNIFIFALKVPPQESVKRNSKRLTCSICKSPILAGSIKDKSCPFCGGRLEVRLDDRKKVISERLREYQDRTAPILVEMKKRGYQFVEIDGTPLPYKIHQKILSYFE